VSLLPSLPPFPRLSIRLSLFVCVCVCVCVSLSLSLVLRFALRIVRLFATHEEIPGGRIPFRVRSLCLSSPSSVFSPVPPSRSHPLHAASWRYANAPLPIVTPRPLSESSTRELASAISEGLGGGQRSCRCSDGCFPNEGGRAEESCLTASILNHETILADPGSGLGSWSSFRILIILSDRGTSRHVGRIANKVSVNNTPQGDQPSDPEIPRSKSSRTRIPDRGSSLPISILTLGNVPRGVPSRIQTVMPERVQTLRASEWSRDTLTALLCRSIARISRQTFLVVFLRRRSLFWEARDAPRMRIIHARGEPPPSPPPALVPGVSTSLPRPLLPSSLLRRRARTIIVIVVKDK